ncbi:MAG TPA: glycosyltransferase [Verrucomicrobiae bacterium]|nr:glycosyltransferase [Verrucomicrobiae bacterium]
MNNSIDPILISIIIATRNRENILWETVEKACMVIENRNAEIIIVNDGDQPLKMPIEYRHKIRYFDNYKRGVSAARNYGVSKSTGTFLFFVDDDMWINKEAMQWITGQMKEEKNTKAVYNLNWEYPKSLQMKLSKTKVGNFILDASYNTMWGRMHERGAKPTNGLYKFQHAASGSLVMHKDIFSLVGGYNESLIFQGEDIDLSARLNKLSIPIYCVFDVTMFHNHADRLDLPGYINRLSNGYRSQFLAEKTGLISVTFKGYKTIKILLFEIFRVSENFWILLHKLIPNNKIFKPFINRLTGSLSSLQQYKQWKIICSDVK